ncbi:phage late control D family protein [Anabaena azotica]|uniref:Phage late control D family protein n=1 Tax=Anabaena azotica FACHB-119 TaxID=947527 RepID=A0ABR8D9D2_9NOST|nr:contractile injection system protein, VgrG/Pvc8 family [Anabaena azotica]MBD2503805.1 phage late control D family protein [Anabaena azotica FACHB-119]
MPVPQPSSPLVADFDILINQKLLSVEQDAHVINVTVEQDLHLPSMLTLEITGSVSRATQVTWMDDQLWAIGNQIEIRMGYANDLATVMSGEIMSLEPEFVANRAPSLTIRGYDLRHRLLRDRQTRTFIQQKDSDIAVQIAQAAGLTPQVKDSLVVHDYIVQANQTDLEFLTQRARLIEYDLYVEDKTLFFQPVANANSKIMTLSLEQDLLEFYPRLSPMHQISQVTLQGWNPKDKQTVVGQARIGHEISLMGGEQSGASLVTTTFGEAIALIIDHPIMTQAEADQLAKAKLNQQVLELIVGEGMSRGRTDLQPGKVIELTGLGKRFSGLYYLTAVTHRYKSNRGYYSHFQVRRNAI